MVSDLAMAGPPFTALRDVSSAQGGRGSWGPKVDRTSRQLWAISGEFWPESGHPGPKSAKSANAANLGPDADASPLGLAVGATSRIMPAGSSMQVAAIKCPATAAFRVGGFQ